MRIPLALCLALAIATPSFGVMLKQDTVEVILEGSLDVENWKGNLELDLVAGMGYFVRDDMEVGGLLAYKDVEFDSLWGIGAFAEYNVDFGLILLPFAGARVLYLDGDGYEDEYFLFTLTTGIKWFLAQNVAISSTINLEQATRDVFQKDGNWINQPREDGGEYTDTNLDLRFGVRCFF